MLAEATIIGRLGRDPELRTTPNGTSVCNFSVATDYRYKKGETTESKTFWANISAFGKTAELCAEYLSKGSLCCVIGRLETQKWESDGQKREKTIIVAQTVKFLTSKNTSNEGDSTQPEDPELEPF
jgi:single-strand DNA-binding protein